MQYVFFYGPGFLALVILVAAGMFARTRVGVVLAGIISATLMVIECLLLQVAAGVGSATSGSQEGYQALGLVFVFSCLSLVAYFLLALTRVRNREDKGPRETEGPER